ncbi:MAG: ABC transporter ATP-binding protein [Myxococcota bacterium]|nr:ABC transporter ATP-binding protein [Myxococcota bacterium]
MSLIEIKGLKKVYRSPFLRREVVGLEHLDLSVERNEIFGFLGPNGAGKSTTLKILTGIIRASAGSATIDGLAVGSPKARRMLGFMPEFPTFHDFLRADEFLTFYGDLSGMARQELPQRIDQVLEMVGLPGVQDRPLRSFSKGMLQRIGLAQAVLHDPDLVILDEPMSGLDPVGRRDVRQLMTGLKAAGKTVLFSSHVLNDVEEIADRVTVVREGRNVLSGSIDELLGGERFELVVRQRPSAGEWRQVGEDFMMICDDEEAAQRQLAELVQAGISVLRCQRERRSLEQLFFEDFRPSGDAS